MKQPLVIFLCNWKHMMHFWSLVRPPFQVEWAWPTDKAKSQGPLRREVWTRSMVASAWSSPLSGCNPAWLVAVGQVCGWVQMCMGEKNTKMTNFNTDGMQPLWTLWVSVSTMVYTPRNTAVTQQHCFVQLQIETFSTPSYIGVLELWEHAGKLETQPLKA